MERNCPAVPPEVGSFMVHVPAASATVNVTVPEVVPANLTCPVAVEAAPSVGVAVNAGPEPPRTCPATPVMDTCPVDAETARGDAAVVTMVPLDVPMVNVGVPAVAWGVMVADPEVLPARIS